MAGTGKRLAVAGGGVAIGCAVLAGVVLVGFLALGAVFLVLLTAGSTSQGDEPQGVTADLSRCVTTDGVYTAALAVTNHTTTTQSVIVTVEWWDAKADTRLVRHEVMIGSLGAGESTTEDVTAVGPPSTDLLRCRPIVH